MYYSVDYSPVDESVVWAWETGKKPKQIILDSGKKPSDRKNVFGGGAKRAKPKLPNKMATIDFITQLTPEDVIYTELGGANDRFCIGAAGSGATLFRLRTLIIHDEKDRQKAAGKVGSDDFGFEETTDADKVESTASIIYRWAQEKPEDFYLFRDIDYPVTRVGFLAMMHYMVQRNIRIATANRLRKVREDLKFLQLGDTKRGQLIEESFKALLETAPNDPDEMEIRIDDKGDIRLRGLERMENRFKTALAGELGKLQLYKTVFEPIKGCGPGIAGFVIATIKDIRRFPNFGKVKTFAGYGLMKAAGKLLPFQDPDGMIAPKRIKGQPSNWTPKLKQVVYYFAIGMDKQKLNHPWKRQLEARKMYEIGKLLAKGREKGREIPEDMTVDKFLVIVRQERATAVLEKRTPQMPKPYKGISAVAHKRALRWLGQKFLEYVWSEWGRMEGIDHGRPLFPETQVSAAYYDQVPQADETADVEVETVFHDPEDHDEELAEVIESVDSAELVGTGT